MSIKFTLRSYSFITNVTVAAPVSRRTSSVELIPLLRKSNLVISHSDQISEFNKILKGFYKLYFVKRLVRVADLNWIRKLPLAPVVDDL